MGSDRLRTWGACIGLAFLLPVPAGALDLAGDPEGVDPEDLHELKAEVDRSKGTRAELSAWVEMHDHADEAGDEKLRKEALERMLILAGKYPDSEEAAEAAMAMADARDLPAADVEKTIRKVVEKAPNPQLKGYALHSLAIALGRCEMTTERLGEMMEIRDRLEKDHAGSVSTASLDHWLDRFGSFVGEVPDFTATDADGKPFKLSDYRGKVFALVFWGFW